MTLAATPTVQRRIDRLQRPAQRRVERIDRAVAARHDQGRVAGDLQLDARFRQRLDQIAGGVAALVDDAEA